MKIVFLPIIILLSFPCLVLGNDLPGYLNLPEDVDGWTTFTPSFELVVAGGTYTGQVF